MKKFDSHTFQGLIFSLQAYWEMHGCIICQPFDIEVGAGTSHPITFFKSLGPDIISAAYVQSSRRPTDGRYGNNPNRLQHYYQFQVIIKPSPNNFQELYIESLKEIGIDLSQNDLRFVEDNWENPTLGACGIGWEVLLNGMEITQFTYFQQMGGIQCVPVTGEITYGLERLSMHLQGVDNIYDIIWKNNITYGYLFYQNEVEFSDFNFKYANINLMITHFDQYEQEANRMLSLKKTFPSYEYVLKAIHIFNILDARKALSVTERQNYILRINTLTKKIAQIYTNSPKPQIIQK